MSIRIDKREHELLEQLQVVGTSFEWVPLEVGDMEVVLPDGGVWRGERKTWMDMAASIRDGRWAEQRERLLAQVRPDTSDRAFYVLEGEAMPEASFGGVQSSALAGAWIHLVFRDHVPVFRTRNAHETAWLLVQLARKGQDPTCIQERTNEGRMRAHAEGLVLQSTKSKNKVAQTQNLVWSQVHGISWDMACRLSTEFPHLRDAVQELEPLTPQERLRRLADIPHPSGKRRLGPKIAQRILDMLGYGDSL